MTKPRLFDQLPTDVNELLMQRLSFRDLVRLRGTHRAGTAAIDNYLLKVLHINVIAQLPRSEAAILLQNICDPKSEYFARLQREALRDDASHESYALYALIADVSTLDATKLDAVISALEVQQCPARILVSLNIIHHYLTHREDYDAGLKQLLADANGAYINLRGANLIANLVGIDLSYADFRETGFYCCVTSASLEGANLSAATIDNRTIFHETNTTGMVVQGLHIGNGFTMEFEVDPITGKEVLEVPELAPIIAAQNQDKDPGNKPGGCNVM
jgi:hypothetical protein